MMAPVAGGMVTTQPKPTPQTVPLADRLRGGPTPGVQPVSTELMNALMRGLIGTPKATATAVEAAPSIAEQAVTAIGKARPPEMFPMKPPAAPEPAPGPAPRSAVRREIEDTARIVREFWAEQEAKFPRGKDLEGNVIDNPSLLINPKWLATGIVETVPALAASLIGGRAEQRYWCTGRDHHRARSDRRKVPQGCSGPGSEGRVVGSRVLGSKRRAVKPPRGRLSRARILRLFRAPQETEETVMAMVAVMRDRRAPLPDRMTAARWLSDRLEPEPV